MAKASDDKKAFYLYNDYIDHVELMSDEDAGKLFKAILRYENGIETGELSGVATIAFSFIKNQLDRDADKYEEICRKNRQNGMKGGRPRKKQEHDENQQAPQESPENQSVPEADSKDAEQAEAAKRKAGKQFPKNFEEFWSVYPRKDDKGMAYAKYTARIKDGFSPEELISAAKAYAEQCRRNRTEKQYIKQAKTFLSDKTPFTDFLKEENAAGNENDGYGEVDFSKLIGTGGTI